MSKSQQRKESYWHRYKKILRAARTGKRFPFPSGTKAEYRLYRSNIIKPKRYWGGLLK